MESTSGKMMLFMVLFFAAVVVGQGGEHVESDHFRQAKSNATALKDAELPQGNADNVEQSNTTHNGVVLGNARRNGTGGGGGGGGGWGYGWGWGWGGAGGGGGGGGGSWGGGCKKQPGKRGHRSRDYKMGEFVECIVRGRCHGMRLDCPLHCGGACLYDCRRMCRARCRTLKS